MDTKEFLKNVGPLNFGINPNPKERYVANFRINGTLYFRKDAIDYETEPFEALLQNGKRVRLFHPFGTSRGFTKIAVIDENNKACYHTAFVKTETATAASRQLVGHALLKAAGLPAATLFKTILQREQDHPYCDLFSIVPFNALGEFKPHELYECTNYFRDHPKVTAQMLCSEIIADFDDDCPGQFVYNKKKPSQAMRVDMGILCGFDDNFKYMMGGYQDLLHPRPYVHEGKPTPDTEEGKMPNFFAIKARYASPSAILKIMRYAERSLTDQKIDTIFQNSDALYSWDELPDYIKRNLKHWRDIIRVNSPDLHQKIVALETRPPATRCFLSSTPDVRRRKPCGPAI